MCTVLTIGMYSVSVKWILWWEPCLSVSSGWQMCWGLVVLGIASGHGNSVEITLWKENKEINFTAQSQHKASGKIGCTLW